MQFSPVAIVLILLGVVAVIVGIRGSNKAVFSTVTGHTTAGALTTPTTLSGTQEVGTMTTHTTVTK